MNDKLNALTQDILSSYANFTNRDNDWVEQLSITDFVEVRKEAILEMEKNISTSKVKKKASRDTTKNTIVDNTQSIQEKNVEVKTKENPITKRDEKVVVEEKPKVTKKTTITPQNNVSKETTQPKEIQKEPIKEIVKEEPKVETQRIQEQPIQTNPNSSKPYDKKHDEEELELFNRLKD